MKRVKFSDEQIRAILEQFSSCVACSQINGEFNSNAFFGAVECSLKILSDDKYFYLNRDGDYDVEKEHKN